jgi:hypothetical protein
MANSRAVTRATPNSIAWILTFDASGTTFVWTNAFLQADVSTQAVQLKGLLAATYGSSALVQAAIEGIGSVFSSSLIYCDWTARQLTGVAQVPLQLVSSASATLPIMTATGANAAATYLVTCWLRGITG